MFLGGVFRLGMIRRSHITLPPPRARQWLEPHNRLANLPTSFRATPRAARWGNYMLSQRRVEISTQQG